MSPSNVPVTAVLVTDACGRIVMKDAAAAYIISFLDRTGNSSHPTELVVIPEVLKPLLRMIGERQTQGPRAAVMLDVEHETGHFTFRAHSMYDAQSAKNSGLIAIQLKLSLPPCQVVECNAMQAGLSARQAQICAHIAAGQSYADIARRLEIRPSTVVDHVRRIFEKLDVHSREELEGRLC